MATALALIAVALMPATAVLAAMAVLVAGVTISRADKA
jgi:hypothetical protein